MDCRNLQFASETFDCIIDKGTTDALLCSNTPNGNIALMLKDCQRVLKTGGIYILISTGLPKKIEPHYMRKHLHFDITTLRIVKEKERPGVPATVSNI